MNGGLQAQNGSFYEEVEIELRFEHCDESHIPAVVRIINTAAERYRGQIPSDCWHEPYMAEEELRHEMSAGVEFLAAFIGDAMAGVMGLQHVKDVALIRHAYVDPTHQGKGVGTELMKQLLQSVRCPVLVGTWADATWAIRFYKRNGFRLLTPAETDERLKRYWSISDRQREVSVVLEFALGSAAEA